MPPALRRSPILAPTLLAACASGPGQSPAGQEGGDAADSGPSAQRPVVKEEDGSAPAPGRLPAGFLGFAANDLLFAVVGDTRPPTLDDVEGYPAGPITRIFEGIAALHPMPSFVIGTGDYQFASTGRTGAPSTAPQQLAMYVRARERYPGPFFPAMGNHECTGATNSNCVAGEDGLTANLEAFTSMLLAPIRQARPYYAVAVSARDGSWTSKFVFVAANAWDAEQEAWLGDALSWPTTYTFVVRHEPHDASSPPPGLAASEGLLGAHPYTLCIVGHSHTYAHDAESPKEVVFGNGGAPLASKDYGYGLFARRADGAIQVDAVDWQTGQSDPAFHFVVR